MRRMRSRTAWGLTIAALVTPADALAADSEPEAVAVCARVMKALGGEQAWKDTRYLRFDFAVERGGEVVMSRAHWWDKWSGDYRLESQTREGEPFVVAMNIDTKEGRAWSGGEELSGEALAEKLEAGFAAWTNDTYWLLMPYKMRDPGVTVVLEGEHVTDDGAWDKVKMTFEGVGLTPKDRYWVYVNRETDLVDRWDYVLKGADEPPTSWTWEGWTEYGAIKLPKDHRALEGDARIFHPVLGAPQSFPEGWMSSGERLSE